jgi:hypothetical protein
METSVGSRVAAIERRAGRSIALRRRAWLVLLLIIAALLIPSDSYVGEDQLDWVILKAVSGEQFDLVSWEIQAIGQKARDLVLPPGATLSPREEHDLVLVATNSRVQSKMRPRAWARGTWYKSRRSCRAN